VGRLTRPDRRANGTEGSATRRNAWPFRVAVTKPKETALQTPGMNPDTRRNPADRDRAIGRLRTITIGTSLASLAAVGGFGAVAAATYTGGSADLTTAAITTTAGTTDTSSSVSTTTSTATTSTSGSSGVQATPAPTTTTSSGTTHATTGGS
jgi:hypothetical protein